MDALELFIDAANDLGEGPCWDALSGRLYWVDLDAGMLHSCEYRSGHRQVHAIGQPIGTAVVRNDGGMILALRDGIYHFDDKTGDKHRIADPEGSLPGNQFNDGKCDPAGRFWAGTKSSTGLRNAGSLYCLDTDRSIRRMIPDTSISNGLGWSPDQKTMYFIDSATRIVMAYDYELATGEIRNPRAVIRFAEQDGLPDGMTVDEEGMLWIAHWDGHRVTRWNPATGALLHTVLVPAKHVTSCAFGGPELNELFITTARTDTTASELAQFPHAGAVFRLRTDVRGLPTYAYMG